mgnify:FL=1
MKITSNDIINELRNAGIHPRVEINNYTKFSRFGVIDPHDAVTYAREYTFFTKPDLHLFKEGNSSVLNPQLSNIPFFKEMHERFNPILQQLQISTKGNPSPFINILTNRSNGGLDLPSLDTLEMETGANAYGELIKYRWMALDSTHEFSMEFLDSKYLEIYLLAKTWEEYSRRKVTGEVSPPSDSYIINKILHDQVCAYKFIVGEDGETILYYAKLYGVYIKNVPRDIFSNFNYKEGYIPISLSFNADFIEDMDPSILVDFNYLTSSYASNNANIPLYNKSINMVDGRFVNMPYIQYVPKSESSISKYSYYKLKWR